MSQMIQLNGRELRLPRPPLVMGILNATPDSFSDGGESATLERALAMLADGADILDVGGESTRPGATAVTLEEELRRVVPLIAAIKTARPDCVVSVDTYKAEVARQALDAGAEIVNDISAGLLEPDILKVATERQAAVVLMHMRGTPRTMQQAPRYDNVFEEVKAYLLDAAARAMAAGVPRESVILDPGLGFGKTLEHNLELAARTPELRGLGFPLLVGHSRKTFIGTLLGGVPPERRQQGTIGASCALAWLGADILRVHDVKGNVEALKLFQAIVGRERLACGSGS